MQALDLLIARLESSGIPYCIVGGLAVSAYGRPRLTLDADLVIALRPAQVGVLESAFPPADFYLPPREVLLAEIQRESRGHFYILHQHSAMRADCYLPGKSELSHWELANRRRISGPWGFAWFAPPEAIIVHKLLFYREGHSEKHLDDIRSIIDSLAGENQDVLLEWIRNLDLTAEWNLVSPS